MSFLSRQAESSLNFINKKLSAFLLCVVISTLFWFLIVLSKDYTSIVSYPVSYRNLPKDKVVINKLPEMINMEVSSFGFNLLRYRYKSDLEPLTIDGEQLRKTRISNEYYLATNSRLDYLEKQLGTNIHIRKILPDTIYFLFDEKGSKRVPIKLNASVSLEKQYHLVNDIVLKPKEVKITGPKSVIDSITHVDTERIVIKNLDKNISRKVPLKLQDTLSGISLSTRITIIEAKVEKYTEASVDLPIEVLNMPAGLHIKTYPERVNITFLVSLSNFDKVKNSVFRVTADYNEIATKKSPRMKLTLAEMPDFVKNIKIEPDKVEYILIKE